jgi:pyruvate/2-oxoglutarate dehydrogenase complex dihydrolipoamide dehydrogenase (E3) component
MSTPSPQNTPSLEPAPPGDTPQTLTPDVAVIGGGSGGLTTAAVMASFGVPVVLIEKHKMGGDCLNVGCVPSKAILAAAKHAHAIMEGPKFGIHAKGKKGAPFDVDFFDRPRPYQRRDRNHRASGFGRAL